MGAFLNVGVVVAIETTCKTLENMEHMRKELIDLTFRSYKINFPNKAGGLKIFETYL